MNIQLRFIILGVAIITAILIPVKQLPADTATIGAVAGDPFGISFNFLITKNHCLHSVIGWSFINMEFQVNMLNYHYRYFIKPKLPIYFGGGLRLRLHHAMIKEFKLTVGLAATVGIEYLFDKPFGIFLETSPVFNIYSKYRWFNSNEWFDFNFYAGFHYYIRKNNNGLKK